MRGPGEPPTLRPPTRPARPAPGPRTHRRRRRLLSVTGAAVVTVVVLVLTHGTGRGGAAAAPAPGPRPTGSRAVGGASATTSPTTTAAPTTTTTGPGTLPQTGLLPSATSPQFQAGMAALWQGAVAGQVAPAMPAFFPVGAYLQLKAIPNARTDWQNRLVAAFAEDVAAVHELLGAGATTATFEGVRVPSQYGHWVTPGICYNAIGYYEVPNARVVYEVGGATRSFGIASMISWRGQWYVVHLGAVLRTTPSRGLVDEPATGPGSSAYSATC
ncbi:MAG: hypothetical protein ACRDYZ_12510 [Acidimicrobiales bacterium]